MSFNPAVHHRRSIRLKGYDYARAGLYFITICVQDRSHLFGDVINGEMLLNDAGRMVDKWYWELENKYPDKHCHEMVVMPNHFHCIIENMPTDITENHMGAHVGAPLRGHPYGTDNKKYAATIAQTVNWFKTMTTNEYIRGVKQLGWPPFNGRVWQRNYYEHIIRNEQSCQRISEYIINNPAKWVDDTFYSR